MAFRQLLEHIGQRFLATSSSGQTWAVEPTNVAAGVGGIVMVWREAPPSTAAYFVHFGNGGWRLRYTPTGALTEGASTADIGMFLGNIRLQAKTGLIDLDTEGRGAVVMDGHRVHSNGTVTTTLTTGTGDLPLTTAAQPIPGLTVEVEIASPADVVWIDGTFDLAAAGGAVLAVAGLTVDGVYQPGEAIVAEEGRRGTPARHWRVTDLAAGVHTIAAVARKTGSAGTATARANSCLKTEVRRG